MLQTSHPTSENVLTTVRRGFSRASDPGLAAQELFECLWLPHVTLAVFFCSPDYDRVALARALRSRFGDIPLIGCTTAGEITPAGYLAGSLTGFSLAAPDFRVVTRTIDLEHFTIREGRVTAQALLQALEQGGETPTGENTFAMLLMDGMSTKAEMVTNALHSGLQDIPLVGGSAGSNPGADRDTIKTFLYQQGEFSSNRAILTLVSTSRPFVVFKTENFVPTDTRLVITEAQPAIRRVSEINGEPAADEYIRLAGVPADTPIRNVSAAHPVGVYVGGQLYLRAAGWVQEDRSITFACAIDEGIVLTLTEEVDLLQNLRQQFDEIRSQIGRPELVLACDCVSRLWQMERNGLKAQAGALMAANHAVGFSTYGEQFNSMHMNQTLTGVAIGRARPL
jgi:hypothetical protein